MAKKTKKTTDRLALKEWEALITSIREATSIDPTDSSLEIERRRKRLEADPTEWRKYYFASYHTAEPAPSGLWGGDLRCQLRPSGLLTY